MMCWMCGSEDPDDFTLYQRPFMCDDCMSILNYWYKEIRQDIKTRHEALAGTSFDEASFLEGLMEFVYIKQTEYNRQSQKDFKESMVRFDKKLKELEK